MGRWGRNRKRQTLAQRWTGCCNSTRAVVRRLAAPVFSMLAGFGMVVGGDAAWTSFRDSPHFRVRQVEVSGAVRMSEAEVLAACGLRAGETRMLVLDEPDVAATCQGDLRIRAAKVQSILPDRVRVRIEEQQPVLAAALDPGIWLVNRFGEAYAPWDPADVLDLPLLIGSSETAGAVEREPLLREAVALLRTTEREDTVWQGMDLVIEHDPQLGFSVVPASRGLAARFGSAPFPRKMKRLTTALAAVKERGLPVAEAFLDDAIRPSRVTLRLGGFGPFADADRGSALGSVP